MKGHAYVPTELVLVFSLQTPERGPNLGNLLLGVAQCGTWPHSWPACILRCVAPVRRWPTVGHSGVVAMVPGRGIFELVCRQTSLC